MVLQVGVKALIQNPQGQYLFLKRAKPYPGDVEPKWDVPGGRIDVGEKLTDALSREIKEETSMELIEEPVLLLAQDIIRDKHVVRLTYLAQAKGDVVFDLVEHQEYKWVDLEDAKSMYLDLFLRPVLDLLLSQKVAS